jgi:hypothetical protein
MIPVARSQSVSHCRTRFKVRTTTFDYKIVNFAFSEYTVSVRLSTVFSGLIPTSAGKSNPQVPVTSSAASVPCRVLGAPGCS